MISSMKSLCSCNAYWLLRDVSMQFLQTGDLFFEISGPVLFLSGANTFFIDCCLELKMITVAFLELPKARETFFRR